MKERFNSGFTSRGRGCKDMGDWQQVLDHHSNIEMQCGPCDRGKGFVNKEVESSGDQL